MLPTRSPVLKAPAIDPAWRSAALVLAAHGLETGIGQAARHAATIESRRLFGEVKACRLRGTPSLGDAVAQIRAERIYVVPFLMAEGYIAHRLVPAALAEAELTGRQVSLCRSIGINPAVAEIVVAKARRLCRAQGWRVEATDLLLIGHGTPRDPGSATVAARHAVNLKKAGGFGRIAVGFLEQAPGVEEALTAMQPQRCVAVGLFADRGPHGGDDVQRVLADWSGIVAYAGPIGEDPGLADIILDQVRRADRKGAA